MPLVFVKKEEFNDYTEGLIRNLIEQLPEFVAEALTIPGTDGELTEKDIEVYVSNFGPKDIQLQGHRNNCFCQRLSRTSCKP